MFNQYFLPVVTALTATLFSVCASAQSTTVVGSTPAEFDVSNGTASYSIPITVAPGRGGMQPELSLNYSSGSGNGVLGVGWSLGGLSAISRCPRTIVQDGAVSGINFDTNDRYCLDGQRLIPVNGVNGGVGTEYKTEIDGYSQIKSIGGAINNPATWVIKTKAGQVITFGGDSNATVSFPQGNLTWTIRSINDSTGNNPINYSYFIDQNTQYLDEINYIGGRVDLVYDIANRPDTRTNYMFGNKVINAKRLKKLESYSNTKLRMYQFEFESTGSANQSRLTSLVECNQYNECTTPTTFFWQDEAVGDFNHWTNHSASRGATRDFSHYFADVNGDGLADWIQVANNSNDGWVGLATGDGNFEHWTTYSAARGATKDYSHYFVDVNGDGLADWI